MAICNSSGVYISRPVKRALNYLTTNMDYKYGGILGEGAYGCVVKVINSKGVSLAAKVVEKRMLNCMETVVWPMLRHENVLKLTETIENLKESVIFLTPLMSCNLFSRIRSEEFKNDPAAIQRCHTYGKQVLNGVAYLHRTGLCHLDLRAENTFLSLHDDRAVIGDFSGLCWSKNKQNFCPLPHPFRPPEVIIGKDRFKPEPVDLWSCGLLLAKLFLGNGFYSCTVNHIRAGHLDAVHLYTDLFRCKEYVSTFMRQTYPASHVSKKCVKNLVNVISGFLTLNPKRRLKAEYALSHPFFIYKPVLKKPDGVKFLWSRIVSSLTHEDPDESRTSEDKMQESKVTKAKESPEKAEKPKVDENAEVKSTQGSKWYRCKQRISDMLLPFRTAPFFRSNFFKQFRKKFKKSSQ